jgi:hypothetical protein
MQRKYVRNRLIDERYTDLERVDFDPAPAPGPQPTPQSRSAARPKFLAVPRVWVQRLYEARGAATFKLANHLLSKEYETHQQTIRLANVALASIGITARQKWRALAELERLGLVRVERRIRKSPMVTLLHPIRPRE